MVGDKQVSGLGKAAPDHAQEWLNSGVDAGIIALNVETLTDTASDPAGDSLFPIAERLNWQICRFGEKTRPALRGWWVSGIDPLTWEPMSWGRFKPDVATPVFDRQKSKPAKYLSPSLGPGSSRLILLRVPDAVWQQVATRYQQQMPVDRSQGFWHWVWQQQLPVILTEGEKKAGCLLSLGYAAIALPGIFCGYRKATGKLISELEQFAEGRTVSICFDFETRPATVQQLRLATAKLGQLLQTAGATVKVISLLGPQKGVDDFVIAQGAAAFEELEQAALRLGHWQSHQLWSLTYPAAMVLNQPYLGDVPYPNSGLVCVKSAKGTGKTTALQALIRHATQTGRKTLVITHRIQLGRAICQSIGIDWIEELRQSDGLLGYSLLGYGLCIDSLHPASQAQFDPQAWRGAIVILDEVEQVLWHALNSLTCYEHRMKILATLRELVQVVLSSDGLLIAQDADLSDLSVSYLLGLTELPTAPWLVVNQWQPPGWEVWSYDTPNPAALVACLAKTLEQGAVFIGLDAQKVQGRWSSKNLECYLKKQFPQKRILRIDSESVADSDHPAYGIVEQINQQITDYDIVLATPTIGSGVSIDVQGHFKAVFGIFQGVIPDAEVRQALARVREPVPRYIWAAPFGPGKVGNGSCSYQDVIASTTRFVKYNIALLKEIDFDLDQQTDPITLRTWAKMAARVNTSLWNYRQQLIQSLQNEGHRITVITPDPTALLSAALATQSVEAPQLYHDLSQGKLEMPGYQVLQEHSKSEITTVLADMAQVKREYQQQEAIAVATAAAISNTEYETLKEQRAKTWEERCLVRRYELQRRYATAITPELKLKDDQGWFTQLRLHYYLMQNSLLVQSRDYREWQSHLDRGDGKIALQDVRLLTAQVEALKGLGIPAILNPEREIRASDTDIQQIAQSCLIYSQDIKTLFNLAISEKMTPIEIVQALLSKLALKLKCIGRDQTEDGRRGGVRIYQYQLPNDNRDIIFSQWQQRDGLHQNNINNQNNDSNIQNNNQSCNHNILKAIPVSTTNDPPPDIQYLNISVAGKLAVNQDSQTSALNQASSTPLSELHAQVSQTSILTRTKTQFGHEFTIKPKATALKSLFNRAANQLNISDKTRHPEQNVPFT
jgi:hypothetical protein